MEPFERQPASERTKTINFDDLEDVVEIPLLLTASQASELAELAASIGLTGGQLLRRLVRHHLLRERCPRPAWEA